MSEAEGVIKFRCERLSMDLLSLSLLAPLTAVRDRCRGAGLIGVGEDGIGYGNVSMRVKEGFAISGSQTGHVEHLGPEGYAEVIQFDVDANRLAYRGPIAPSSESLTHAMIYQLDRNVGCVLHIHSRELFDRFIDRLPTTGNEVPYGTPAMAREIARLWEESALRERKTLVMGGHDGGLIAFGDDPEEAESVLFALTERGS